MHHLRTSLSRRRNRWLLFGAAIALVVLGALVLEIQRIRRDLVAGEQMLSDINLTTVEDEGGLAAVADRALARLESANRRARTSPILRALSPLPVIGAQVGAARDLTHAVVEVGRQGRDAAHAIDEALDTGSGPDGRLAVVAVAREQLAGMGAQLEQVELGADGWLLPPLADARRDLVLELADARSDIERSSTLAEALESFLVGPRRYLVLGGNNAEMRAVGIPTTSGIANIADGAIEVGEFSGATDGIELVEPGVPVPFEYEALYGWLNGDRGYRTTLATANWPEAARIAADITARNDYGPVEGIIYVDTITLAVLLDVIGPVEVDGVEYSFDNVLEELLHRNYLRFETVEDNPERKALQSEIAQAVFDEIERRDYSILELAGRLAELARGRHLLAWSADPAENALWEAFDADGSLQRDGIGVVTQDLGASKLDYFINEEVEVRAREDGDFRRVTLRVRIIHREHTESSPYIDGGGRWAEPGEYGAFLVAYLPRDAAEISIDTGITHHGRDGPMYAAATILRVPEATTREVEVDFLLPIAQETLTVMPSSRLLGTRWIFGDERKVDFEPFEIDLTELD